jgi:hypothetical protein
LQNETENQQKKLFFTKKIKKNALEAEDNAPRKRPKTGIFAQINGPIASLLLFCPNFQIFS